MRAADVRPGPISSKKGEAGRPAASQHDTRHAKWPIQSMIAPHLDHSQLQPSEYGGNVTVCNRLAT